MIDSEECFNQGKSCNRIVKLYDFEMYFKQLKNKKKKKLYIKINCNVAVVFWIHEIMKYRSIYLINFFVTG